VEILDDGAYTWQSTYVAGVSLTSTRVVIATGESETLTFYPARYEGHTFVDGYQVSDTTGEAPNFSYTEPLEPFERVNFRDTGPVLDLGGVFTTDSNEYDVVITHQNGGAVTDVRYDGSAACGYVAIQDDPDNTQAAVWGSDHNLRVLGLPGGYDSARATGISQAGDIAVCGWGFLSSGERGWWVWSEATGFVDVSVGSSVGYCISQDGSLSGGMTSVDSSVGAGTADMVDVASGTHTSFSVPTLGECYDITSFAVYKDEATGIDLFLPPMPGLKLELEPEVLALPAGERPSDDSPSVVDDDSL
jgi:hypothetical protein